MIAVSSGAGDSTWLTASPRLLLAVNLLGGFDLSRNLGRLQEFPLWLLPPSRKEGVSKVTSLFREVTETGR